MAIAQYLLTFREVFEAALLVAIVLAFLTKSGRGPMTRYAWYGVVTAAAASFAVGGAVLAVYRQLPEDGAVLFEGVAALVAVAVLTSMIYWMSVKGREIRQEVETRVRAAVTQGAILGVASVTFVLVFREGLETVLFLTPYLGIDPWGTVGGGLAGFATGIGVAYAIFRVGVRLDIRRFFYFTSVLLILVAGGLLGYGIHELLEYGELVGVDTGWWGTAAYNLGIPAGDLLHHKGAVGSILAVMFGYTVRAEWARLIAHGVYLAVTLPLVIVMYRRPDLVASFASRIRALLRLGRPVPAQQDP